MTPKMEELFLRSPLGQQIRAAGIAEAEREEKTLLKEIDRLDMERDAAVSLAEKTLAKEMPELRQLQEELEQMKEKVRRKHGRVSGDLPSLIANARREHALAVGPLEKRLAEVREGAAQLRHET